MKKKLLITIANDEYFQPYFLKELLINLRKTNYQITKVFILKNNSKKSLQSYLLKNLNKVYLSEFLKLLLLKFNLKLANFFLKKKIINISKKKILIENNISFLSEVELSDKIIYKILKKEKYSFIINTGGQIFENSILKLYKNKIVNIHLSLLPKYAGVWTMFQQLANNEKYTGITIHKINNKIDSGKLILQKKIKLNKKFSIFENQLNCYTKIPNLLKKCLNKDFKATKIIKTDKIYGYPNNYEWKKFRSNKGKII